MSRKQQKAMFAKKNKPRKKASDFGDNPRVRHSYGEHKQKSKKEPWEKADKHMEGKLGI